jgi:hypothetical protein
MNRNRRLRGRWFRREEFYSVCSRHYQWREDCNQCQAGMWRNIWMHHVSAFFNRFAYPLWHWWVNRPNSRSRRELEKLFPGLKEDHR